MHKPKWKATANMCVCVAITTATTLPQQRRNNEVTNLVKTPATVAFINVLLEFVARRSAASRRTNVCVCAKG